MKKLYKTIYKASYGIVTAEFKKEMIFEEAEKLGKEYCKINNHEYIRTEER